MKKPLNFKKETAMEKEKCDCRLQEVNPKRFLRPCRFSSRESTSVVSWTVTKKQKSRQLFSNLQCFHEDSTTV